VVALLLVPFGAQLPPLHQALLEQSVSLWQLVLQVVPPSLSQV
jgi:hypothetical protein